MFFSKQWTFINQETFLKVKESFTTNNEKKSHQKRLWFWGWQKLPDEIKHFEKIWENYLVPPGIRSYRKHKMQDKYIMWSAIDFPELYNPNKWNELDERQNKVVHELLENDVWLLHASTWVWKTYITAKLIKNIWRKTLVVVPGIELMNQMKKDLQWIFWKEYKTISSTSWKQKNASDDICIVNIDSLVKQEKEFFEMFDLCILDEADTYIGSDTRREIIWKSITCKHIYALTGTIKVNHTPEKVLNIYFGKKTELLEKHFSPDIYRVLTDFSFNIDDMKEFHNLKKNLYCDNTRNNLIVKTVLETLGERKWILFSEYVEHAKYIKSLAEEAGIKCFLLIGEIDDKQRKQIKEDLIKHKWRCLLIGSVKIIGRWFNVPELSVWYLTTAEKFVSNIEQYVWRIIRKFPWKESCEWYDFVDPGSRNLFNQSKSRLSTYKKEFPKSSINYYNM